jgi:hypothetical protein
MNNALFVKISYVAHVMVNWVFMGQVGMIIALNVKQDPSLYLLI